MKLRFAFLVSLLVLGGCATTENYEKMLGSWVGASELELVRRWGAPQRTFDSGGRKFLEYASDRNVFIPGVAPTYTTSMIGNTAYTKRVGGSASQNIAKSCQTTFELLNDRIQSWRYYGNDCKAMK